MSGVKISNLPAIVTPDLTDVFPVSQGGVTYKETVTQLQALLNLNSVTVNELQNQSFIFAVDSGAADAYVATLTTPITLYVAGQRFDLLISNTNTGASTLNVSALGAVNITRINGDALQANDLVAGQIASFEYDGTNFQLLTPARRLLGTQTNDNAPAGYVGEYISSVVLQADAVAVTTATSTEVTHIDLTAGDWDVNGSVSYIPANTTVCSSMFGTVYTSVSISSTVYRGSMTANSFTGNGSATPGVICPTRRFSLSAPATIYLVAYSDFTTSTNAAFGFINARRVR